MSRATIRQAIGQLVMERRVVRRQGRGTYVEERDASVLQQRYRGSLGELIRESHRAKTRNLEVAHDVPFPSAIASALQLSGPVGTVVRRTRVMDNEPFAYTVTYLPPDLGEKVTVIGLRRKALMELLIDAGVVLSSATQAIRAQLADVEVCAQIDLELGGRCCSSSGSCTTPRDARWSTCAPGTAATATSTRSPSTSAPTSDANPYVQLA